jgi:hypothetical protein
MARPAWTYAEGRGQGDSDSSSDSSWLNSKYTPSIARATNRDQAEASLLSDPASNKFIVDAARQWYVGQSGFRPQWAEGFLRDDIIPAAQELGISPYTLLQQIRTQGVTKDSGAIPTGGSRGSGGGGGGGGFSTQQSIDLSSPTQARGLLMQTMQGVLGRDPNSEEYENFLKILNEAQSGSPQIATASGSTVTRSGGVDAGVVALDYAQSRDDYEDVQNKQYYDMFLDVLAGG